MDRATLPCPAPRTERLFAKCVKSDKGLLYTFSSVTGLRDAEVREFGRRLLAARPDLRGRALFNPVDRTVLIPR